MGRAGLPTWLLLFYELPGVGPESRAAAGRADTGAMGRVSTVRCRRWRDNPESRRSPLVNLTPEGRRTIQQMRRREGRFISTVVTDGSLAKAASVLRESGGLWRTVPRRIRQLPLGMGTTRPNGRFLRIPPHLECRTFS